MERIALAAVARESGKGVARKLRSAGKIPAILYGGEKKPQALAIDALDFKAVIKASPDLNAIVDLKIDGGKQEVALVRDYQADVFSRAITHLDFQLIDMTEKIDLEIPVNLIGIPQGVKDGGILEQLRRKIHIRTLPTNIPSHIDIDVSSLTIGQNIHADEIALPAGVEFPHATNYAIATVVPPQKEEVAAAPVATAEGEAAGATGAPAAAGGEAAAEASPAGKEPAKKEQAKKE